MSALRERGQTRIFVPPWGGGSSREAKFCPVSSQILSRVDWTEASLWWG